MKEETSSGFLPVRQKLLDCTHGGKEAYLDACVFFFLRFLLLALIFMFRIGDKVAGDALLAVMYYCCPWNL